MTKQMADTCESALYQALTLVDSSGQWVGEKRECINYTTSIQYPNSEGPNHSEIVDMLDDWHGEDHFSTTTQWTFPYTPSTGLTGELRPNDDTGDYFKRLTATDAGNQLTSMVDKIDQWGRNNRTCAQVFMAERDLNAMFPPCLMTLQAFYRNDEISLTAYFRSHTLAKSYYGDLVALGRLQQWLASEVEHKVDIGRLVVHSGSLHWRKKNDEHELAQDMLEVLQ